MLTDKSMEELAALLEKGETTAVQIVDSHLKRIEQLDKSIHAYITVDKDALRSQAEQSDKRRSAGKALSRHDGIPVAIKDNIATRGMKTTCASRILSDFIPPYDATVHERLKARGFLTMGKTNLDEFAMGSSTESSYFGTTRNPYDLTRVPGGSSGGSAAAVAAKMAPAALGSDTGGSIRQPAAFCGVVGIKPTYGRVSRFGLVAYASSLDQIGTFARSVDDAALLLSVIAGHDVRDTTSIDRPVDYQPDRLDPNVKGTVIGVPDEYFRGITDDIRDALMKKIGELEAAGARIEKISLKYTEYAIPIYYLIATAEASSNLARYDGIKYGYRSPEAQNLAEVYLRSRSDGFGKEVKRRIILGTFSLSSGYYDAYYLRALKGRKLIIDDFREAFSRVDAIISPVTTTSAFKIGEMITDPLQMYMSDVLTISCNLAGIPGISVPIGVDRNGLPIGLQIMGSHFEENKILSLAKAVENISEPIAPNL